uniref:Sugar phosphate transporter domain-containing protein n=1 Tax=Chlamydomonas euryale TaxID=1486919 RepID=A0A7R9V8B6_9CHLO|mmetsp:Transcript_25593/g.75648  ORF Transcript_25593/g.75648 Transcript_25593/m.75648 type:complete len:169 (+) Transcript_25593:189-695(+)
MNLKEDRKSEKTPILGHEPGRPTGTAMVSKQVADAAALLFNVSSSVLIVFVNKLLMDPRSGHGFVFATTLCSLHFFSAALCLKMLEYFGVIKHSEMPVRDTLAFSIMASMSIGSLNLSLLINTVGFYQIAKLLIIPFVCVVEFVWMNRTFRPPVIGSILTVVLGVAVV